MSFHPAASRRWPSRSSHILPAVSNSGIASNYLATLPNLVNNDSGTAKVDYNISAKNRIFGIFTRGKYANPITGSLARGDPHHKLDVASPVHRWQRRNRVCDAGSNPRRMGHSSDLVNDFGYGVSRLYIPLTSNTAGGNYPAKAGLTGLPAGVAATGFPDVTFGGNNNPVSWDGTNSHANIEAQTTFTAQDNVLWTKGRHQFTFGFQWQALQDNDNNPLSGTQAGFSFAQAETSNFTSTGALNTATGLAYASYMLGAVDSSTVVQNAVIETGGRYKTYAPYVQDNIQVSPNLTVNLGLRWDIWTPFVEVENRVSFFNPNIPNPVAGNILGALQFAGNGADSCGCRHRCRRITKTSGPGSALPTRSARRPSSALPTACSTRTQAA